MNRLIFLLSILLMGNFAVAQSLRLSDSSGFLANGDTIVKSGGDFTIDVHAYITNKTTSDLNVMLKKTLIAVMPGSSNYYCWGVCYPADTLISTYPVIIYAQQTDFLNFTGHYTCNGNPGTAIIRYTFFNQQDPADSICIHVVFHACLTSGLAQPNEQAFLSPYPNPANDRLFFPFSLTTDQLGETYVELRNLQGSLIQQMQLPGREGELLIPVSAFPRGMYYCSLLSHGLRLYCKKIVIQ